MTFHAYLSIQKFLEIAQTPKANTLPKEQSSDSLTTLLQKAFKNPASPLSLQEEPNTLEALTNYNNYIEFSRSKRDVGQAAEKLPLQPWSLTIEGECHKPRRFSWDELLRAAPMETRIFPLRCVEGWAAIVPWQGFSLTSLLQSVEPNAQAQYVVFESYYDKAISSSFSAFYGLKLPYTEGLRLDEAMHPLTTLAFGQHGSPLTRQAGGPLRLVVPWKYGFKSAKSLVKIRLTKTQPETTWNLAQPDEYGFYANVNPQVPHPRWSQSRERRLGSLFSKNTRMFNGFESQVASLYKDMDLKTYY